MTTVVAIATPGCLFGSESSYSSKQPERDGSDDEESEWVMALVQIFAGWVLEIEVARPFVKPFARRSDGHGQRI